MCVLSSPLLFPGFGLGREAGLAGAFPPGWGEPSVSDVLAAALPSFALGEKQTTGEGLEMFLKF